MGYPLCIDHMSPRRFCQPLRRCAFFPSHATWRPRRAGIALVLLLLAWGVGAATGGVIAPAPGQPAGALTGRIVFTSGGHGWVYDNARDGWYTQRADNNEVVEDYGNLDQMTLFVAYCFNAGATVVPLRPVGFQTNEVVLDNTSPAVRFSGAWSDSTATSGYYGQPGQLAYRFASLASNETATATYTPTLPAEGFYPVYCWAAAGGNRTFQLYRVRHTGGEALVRVPHHMVGNGWIYLGTYHFNAGSNAASGAVIVSNWQPTPPVGNVAIADAIRFGNGRGDVVPVSTGGGTPRSSGYPREEECSRYWVQRALGVGASSTIYDASGDDGSDNVGAPPRMAAHMNREAEGSARKRAYLGFHSNAASGTARGCVGLYNNTNLFPGTATPNQFRLAQLIAFELNGDMAAQTNLEVSWSSRASNSLTYARSDYAFGEINNSSIGEEFDATIIEVAFHDNVDDARLMRDPRVRNIMARASYQGLLRYMNEFDGAPLTFLPEPPANLRALANPAGAITVSWDAPGGGGGAATGYRVYLSTNGYGFGWPLAVAGGAATSVTLTNLAPDVEWYFRVAATNAGGESMPSETVGCRWSGLGHPPVLVVNGFDRFDRTLNFRQTAGPGIGSVFGGTQTFDRVLPRYNNSGDYVVPFGRALGRCGVAFNSCQNEAVINNQVRLTDYRSVLWACGQESTADRTFNSTEQSRLTAFLSAGGNLFVSGSEIAWDLDRDVGPSSADRAFLNDVLRADLGGDPNDDAGTYTFAAVAGSIFAGNAGGRFDDGTTGFYSDVAYPDRLTPVGANALAALQYSGGLGGTAGLQHTDAATGSRLVYFGFPFEAITTPAVREACLWDILKFFRAIPAPVLADPVAQPALGRVTLAWTALPGRQYQVQYRASLDADPWLNLGAPVTATNAIATRVDAAVSGVARRFYRVLLAD
jgi:hypothetical protein